MFAIRREHTVESGEVQARTWHQRRQARDEVQGVENDMRRAVAKRLLELVDDLARSLVERRSLAMAGRVM